jgi:peptidyl-prolyl cis-trans isomerase SurA
MNLRGLAPFCIPCLVLSAGEVREEILVVVNAHIITLRDYQQAVEQGSAALYREFSGQELDAKLRGAREKTLQGLIDSFVLADKAADLGVVISDEGLRSYVEELKKQNNFTSDADFERALKGSLGIGLQAYLDRSRQDLLKQEVLRRDVYSRVAVDEQELLAYYQEHRLEYRLPSRFRIRELVLPKGVTPEEQKDTETRLAEIQAELKKGTPFETLVKYSTAPSRSTGGDLGWLNKGVLRPDLEEAVLGLKPWQVSAPVTTDKDVYLLQLTDSEMDKAKPFAEVRASILEKLQEPKAQSAIEAYIQGLRIRANIRYMVPKDTILKG